TFLLAGDQATQTPQVALTDQDHPRTAHHAMNHVHLLVGRHSRLDHPVTPHVLQDHHATPHTSVQHLVLDPLGRTCEHDETDEEGHRQTRQWPQDPGAGPDTDTDEDGEDQQSHGHRERDAAGTLLMDDLGDHPDLFEATGLLLGTTRAG